ncbi:MAG: hypothetical protein L0I76_31205 [Pseudonocardia sp.]|nr:hypothetical protein [Pseudonocardia sp.]
MVRFSTEELDAVRSRAALAGLAVGAWLGQTAMDAAAGRDGASAGLPDLLRLHSDVVRTQQSAAASGVEMARVEGLLVRLDAVIDAVTAEFERGRR